MFFDWTYVVLVLPAVLLAMWASANVNSTFRRYSTQYSRRGITGAQAARRVLDANGLTAVRIEHISGNLTDHYDPKANVIRLSDQVYDNTSTAAIGVACHEAGHAVQHAVGYAPIRLRTAIVPITNIGSRLSMPLILVGLLLSVYSPQMYYLVYAGIACFGLAALFQLVTLPTEFNASSRALAAIESGHLLYDEEMKGARKTLRAAALTYVAALAVSLTQLLRLLVLFGGNSRRRGKTFRVTSIGYRAFYNNQGITSVVIPEGVTDVGYSAFFMCMKLAKIRLL